MNFLSCLQKDFVEPLPGYLSLHQSPRSLTIKWTPNQLLNGNNEEIFDKTFYWEYSLNINLEDIVYVHCHQTAGVDSGGTVILVGQDGVQRPPIGFPEGGHMLQFLTNLETGKTKMNDSKIFINEKEMNRLLQVFCRMVS